MLHARVYTRVYSERNAVMPHLAYAGKSQADVDGLALGSGGAGGKYVLKSRGPNGFFCQPFGARRRRSSREGIAGSPRCCAVGLLQEHKYFFRKNALGKSWNFGANWTWILLPDYLQAITT